VRNSTPPSAPKGSPAPTIHGPSGQNVSQDFPKYHC
jgi:hypothetical protein